MTNSSSKKIYMNKHFQNAVIGLSIAAGVAVSVANWDKVEDIWEACSGQFKTALSQAPR